MDFKKIAVLPPQRLNDLVYFGALLMLKLYWAEWWVLISQYHRRNNQGGLVHKLKWFPRTRKEYSTWVQKNRNIVPLSTCAEFNANRVSITKISQLQVLMVKDPFVDREGFDKVTGRWSRCDTRTFYHEFMWILEHIDSLCNNGDEDRKDKLTRGFFWEKVDEILIQLTDAEATTVNRVRVPGSYPIIWKTINGLRFVDWSVCTPLLYQKEVSSLPAQQGSRNRSRIQRRVCPVLPKGFKDKMFQNIDFNGPLVQWIFIGRIAMFRMSRSNRAHFKRNSPKSIYVDLDCFTNGGTRWSDLFNNDAAQTTEIFNKIGQYFRTKFRGQEALRDAILYNSEHYAEDDSSRRYHLFRYNENDVEEMKELLDNNEYYDACRLAQTGVITTDFFQFLVKLRIHYNREKIAHNRRLRNTVEDTLFDKQFKKSIVDGEFSF